MSRPTPFDLVFQQIAQDTFPRIQEGFAEGGADPRDRDRFLMARDVVALIRDLRPDEGLGDEIDQLAALVHHAYLFWTAGAPVLELPADRTAELLAAAEAGGAGDVPPAFYVQFPERRIWAQPVAGQPHEPLDGCFIHPRDDGSLRVLGVFGVHPDRMGFTVVESAGPRPVGLRRPDESPLFAPVLPGGAAAGLHSLLGGEELLELGWRARDAASEVTVR